MKRPMNRKSTGMGLADLLVVVVLIPLAGMAIFGCYRHSHGNNNLVKCAANLKSIGQALMLYANENRGEFPRTVHAQGEKVIPTWGTGASARNPFAKDGPEPNDVTAAIYLLLTTQESTAEVYVCPSSDAEKWDFGGGANTAGNWSNWDGDYLIKKHLSYSMQNPYPDDAAVSRGFKWNQGLGADYALLADMNPGTTKPNRNVLKIKVTDTSAPARRLGNSRNHEGDGQNILFGDGHVDFSLTPFYGINQDNIYARRAGPDGTASSAVRDSSFDGTDNVLLPTDN